MMLRPAWATTDPQWREGVGALAPDDLEWIERQWETAGGSAPQVDMTWVTYEPAGGGVWLGTVAVFVAVAVPAWLIVTMLCWVWVLINA